MAEPINIASRRGVRVEKAAAAVPVNKIEERDYEAARAKALITKYLGVLRDNAGPLAAIKFLDQTLLAVSGHPGSGPGQQELTAVAIEAIAETVEKTTAPMTPGEVAAYLRDIAGRIRAGGGK